MSNVTGLVPNCAFIEEQAGKINGLNIPWNERLIQDDQQRTGAVSAQLPDITNSLSDAILRQEFVAVGPPNLSEQLELLVGNLAFSLGELDLKFLRGNIEFTKQILELQFDQRTKIENRIDAHVHRWHLGGRQRCYRTSEYDSPAVCIVAAARQVGDVLLRRA